MTVLLRFPFEQVWYQLVEVMEAFWRWQGWFVLCFKFRSYHRWLRALFLLQLILCSLVLFFFSSCRSLAILVLSSLLPLHFQAMSFTRFLFCQAYLRRTRNLSFSSLSHDFAPVLITFVSQISFYFYYCYLMSGHFINQRIPIH